MGMTIDEIEFALNSIKIVLEHTEKGYYPEQFKTHEKCLKEVMDIVRKYQKDDAITILEDLKDKMLYEHTFDTRTDKKFQHGMDLARRQDLATVQEKINALRGEENGNDNQQSHGNPNS